MMLLSLLVASIVHTAACLSIDPSSSQSICDAASTVADGVLDYYAGLSYGGTVGMVVEPYYWWQAGETFGSLLRYSTACDNKTMQSIVHEAIVSQLGPDKNLMVSNFSSSEGNDDQGVWSLTIMDAAESNFDGPDDVSWIDVATNTFWSMFNRWDSECQGGIRWQIFPNNNNGYSYKNTIANGALFALSARLGKFKNDVRYLYIADFIYSWATDIGFVVESDNGITVYDGGNADHDCKDIGKDRWSYNYGILLLGTAVLYNKTSEQVWLQRTEKLVNSSMDLFFDNGIPYEQECVDLSKKTSSCNNDQRSFRAIYLRALAETAKLVPQLSDTIEGAMKTSAEAAARSCSGGSDGVTCGLIWNEDSWDGKYGLGEQLSALEAFIGVL